LDQHNDQKKKINITFFREWLAPEASPPSRVPHRLPAHILPVALTGEHVGLARANGDRLHLPASDTEARQQEGEEGDATLDLVLKHLDAIATYV
jgi:hypothetical protein